METKWFNFQYRKPKNLQWVLLWTSYEKNSKTRDWVRVCQYIEDLGYVDQEKKVYQLEDMRTISWSRWKTPN